jgi:hypothetical protein
MFIFYFTDEWRVPLKRGSKVGHPWKAPRYFQGLHVIIKRLNHQGISSKYLHLKYQYGQWQISCHFHQNFAMLLLGAPHHQYIIKNNCMRIKKYVFWCKKTWNFTVMLRNCCYGCLYQKILIEWRELIESWKMVLFLNLLTIQCTVR